MSDADLFNCPSCGEETSIPEVWDSIGPEHTCNHCRAKFVCHVEDDLDNYFFYAEAS